MRPAETRRNGEAGFAGFAVCGWVCARPAAPGRKRTGPKAGPRRHTNFAAVTLLRPPNVILVLSDSVMVLDPPAAASAA